MGTHKDLDVWKLVEVKDEMRKLEMIRSKLANLLKYIRSSI